MPKTNPVKIDLPLVCTDNYLVHNRGIRIRTNNPIISKTLHNLLEYFTVSEKDSTNIDATFSLYSCSNFKELSSALLPKFSNPISFSEDILYFMQGDCLYTISPDKAAVICDLSRMEVWGILQEHLAMDPWMIFQLFFSPAFLEILKKLGVYNLHASTVCQGDNGVFFSAATGSGKTTLAVCLVRSGFGFLSDDITFVSKNGSDAELLAFPQPIQMWDDALQRFPELHRVKFNHAFCKGYKKQFRAENVYPGSVRERTSPKVLIFPKLINQKESRLEKLSNTKALVELIPQSLIVAQRSIVKDHLDILSDLIDCCDCYRLFFGSDIDCIPKLISDLL
jgi:hypothetical protein